MQILQIILSLMGIVAYVVTALFACYAFGRLKRQEDELDEIKYGVKTCIALAMGEHIRNSFNEINDMKEVLEEMIEDERFEEAERLKTVIAKAESGAMRELERFREHFGKDCVDVTSIKRKD